MQGNQGYMKTFTEGENPLECKQYGNCFSQARKSMVHESVPTGEKLFECKQYGKCFTLQEAWGYIKQFTLVNNLLNVNSVASVLVKQET